MVVQLYWLFLLVGLFQKGRQALICSLLEVILMAKIKIISHPFQVIPVLPGGNSGFVQLQEQVYAGIARLSVLYFKPTYFNRWLFSQLPIRP